MGRGWGKLAFWRLTRGFGGGVEVLLCTWDAGGLGWRGLALLRPGAAASRVWPGLQASFDGTHFSVAATLSQTMFLPLEETSAAGPLCSPIPLHTPLELGREPTQGWWLVGSLPPIWASLLPALEVALPCACQAGPPGVTESQGSGIRVRNPLRPQGQLPFMASVEGGRRNIFQEVLRDG